MGDVWIADASPLIALARIEQLELLDALSNTVLIPSAVREEVLAGPAEDLARQKLQQGWGQPAHAVGVPDRVIEWGLGPGESEVIALGLERPGATLVLDDAEARSCARTLGLRLIGTVAVVLRAQQAGIVPSAAAVFRHLRDGGFHLSDELVEKVLETVGETWSE